MTAPVPPVDAAQFRTDFPEFASQTTYPDTMVDFWLSVAALRLPQNVWCELWPIGVELFTAHNVVLEGIAMAAAAKGAPPGAVVGPSNSRSVDKVSVGYDTAVATVKDAGNYNMTTYGTRFAELVNIVGVRGVTQVGADGGIPWTYGLWGYYPFPFIT